MMDEFIHWPKPYLLLSATCDEILSWMIEIWMKNHLVSDNNCNIVKIKSLKYLQGMANNVGLKSSVGDNSKVATGVKYGGLLHFRVDLSLHVIPKWVLHELEGL